MNNAGDWSDQVDSKLMPTLCMNRGQSTGHVDGHFASLPLLTRLPTLP
jgi:hypothetical protein